MRRSLFVAGTVFGTLAVATGVLAAQGSAVMTHSSCATAMGAAGVARPCEDGSAVLFNPAGIAHHRSTIGIGWTGITTGGSFTYDYTGETVERETATTSVPFAFATYRFNDRLAAGIGVFNPYGLGLEWPETFEGRFASYRTALRNIYIQPTVAYRAAPWLSVGAGVDVVAASINIDQRIDLATTATGQNHPVTGQPLTFGNLGVPMGTDFANAELEGKGTGVGFHLGVITEIAPWLSLGIRYMSDVTIDYDGTAGFTQVATGLTLAGGNPLNLPGGTPVDAVVAAQFGPAAALGDGQAITTSLTLPAQLVVGASIRPLENLTVLADYQFTRWSAWDRTDINFANQPTPQALIFDYQDAHTYRVGAEFGATEALAVRAGFIYNTAAQTEFAVSPLLPEAERNYYTLGLGYRITPSLAIDAGYQLIDQSDRRGRVRGRPDGLSDAQLRALNVGVFTSDANVINVTLSYRFGGAR
jgi:long-chain fatty acid transport protein